DGTRALLLAYTTERLFTDQHTRIRLHGLCASRRYAMRELLPDETGFRCPLQGRVLGGDLLMTQGLPLHWSRPMQSCALLLEPESV
ncbi:MAG: GH36 C-terminal domain-containing protein, partial [Akkermansia sp.]